MPAKLSKLNQSVEKALQIIEIMMKEPEAMRLQDIALKAEMPPSTALRMINTLLVYGYVNQDPGHAALLALPEVRSGRQCGVLPVQSE